MQRNINLRINRFQRRHSEKHHCPSICKRNGITEVGNILIIRKCRKRAVRVLARHINRTSGLHIPNKTEDAFAISDRMGTIAFRIFPRSTNLQISDMEWKVELIKLVKKDGSEDLIYRIFAHIVTVLSSRSNSAQPK